MTNKPRPLPRNTDGTPKFKRPVPSPAPPPKKMFKQIEHIRLFQVCPVREPVNPACKIVSDQKEEKE